MLRHAFRSILAHRARFLLSAAGVVLSVAFVVGSLLYGNAVTAAFNLAQARAQADVAVKVEPGLRSTELGDDVVVQLRALPGVAQVRPIADGYAFLVTRNGEIAGQPERAGGTSYDPSRHRLSAGQAPVREDQIVLDELTAEHTGYRVGDQARVIVNGVVHRVEITGVFTADDPRLAAGGSLVAFDLRTASELLSPNPGGYTAADLVAAPGASQEEIAKSVRAALPSSFTAATGESLNTVRSDDKLTSILLLFAGVALFVAVFLVANTFTMLATARARENALLRAVGASRRYVLRSVLAEAALLGSVATVLGYALGIGVAAVLNSTFSVLNGPDVPLRAFSLTAVGAAVGVGIGVTTVAAYVPARRAAAVPPVAALRTGLAPTAKSLRRRNIAGVTLFVLGAAITLAAIDSQDLIYAGAPLLMIGLIVLTPWVSTGLTKVLRGPLTRLRGMPGTLAVENARRNPRRTAATATTLMIGLSVCAAVTVAISSAAAKDAEDARTGDNADVRITTIPFSDLSSGTVTDVAKVPGVQAVSPLTPVSIKLGERRFLTTTAVDASNVRAFLPLTVTSGSLGRLDEGIAVSTATADRYDLQVGSLVTGVVQAPGATEQPVALPVVATYDAPEASGQAALVPARLAPRSAAPQTILVKAASGQDPAELRDRLRKSLDNPVLVVRTKEEPAEAATSAAESFLNILYALLSVSVLIGALGVVNTMTMSTLERVREIGLLRAVGLSSKRVGSVLRLESVIIAVLGAGLGLLAGAGLGVVGVLSQKGIPVVVPWAQLGAFVLITALIGIFASFWPARTASRTPILTAIHADTE